MGVEPTLDQEAGRATVLKTARPTGTRPPPGALPRRVILYQSRHARRRASPRLKGAARASTCWALGWPSLACGQHTAPTGADAAADTFPVVRATSLARMTRGAIAHCDFLHAYVELGRAAADVGSNEHRRVCRHGGASDPTGGHPGERLLVMRCSLRRRIGCRFGAPLANFRRAVMPRQSLARRLERPHRGPERLDRSSGSLHLKCAFRCAGSSAH